MSKPEPPPQLRPGDPEYSPFLDEIRAFGVGYYDRDGNPITMRQAAELDAARPKNEPGAYARIAEDVLDEGNIWVSTVWLGLDHSFSQSGPPLIFETMVFVRATEEQLAERLAKWTRKFGGPELFPWEDLQSWRWATEDEARDGHRKVVESLRVRMDLLEQANGGTVDA